jgi:hypothetical protein
MDRTYISLADIQKYKEEVKDCFAPLHREVINAFVYGLAQLSPAEITPVNHGKWVSASNKPGVQIGMKCSLCGARIKYSEFFNGNHNYCHKCGAKMSKEY